MFWLKVFLNLFNPENFRTQELKELEATQEAINEDIKEIELKYTDPINKQVEVDEINKNECQKTDESNDGAICFTKTGILTHLNDTHGIIDEKYMFNLRTAGFLETNPKIGTKIEYLGYSLNEFDEEIKIRKIISISSRSWDEAVVKEEDIKDAIKAFENERIKPFQTHERNIIGIILEKTDYFLKILIDHEIWVDCESLSLEFVPQEGDRIVLHCIVQTDETYLDDCGETLEYKSITPTIKKTIYGYVTSLDDNLDGGTVNHDYYFMSDVLGISRDKPCIGDHVTVEVIENNKYEKFHWRCIKLNIIEKSRRITNTQNLSKTINQIDKDSKEEKNGITMTSNLKFKFESLTQEETKILKITNDSNNIHRILRCCIKGSKKDSQLTVLKPLLKSVIILKPGDYVEYHILAKSSVFGLSSEIFEATFDGTATFKMARKIEIDVGDSNTDTSYTIHECTSNKNQTKKRDLTLRNYGYASMAWQSDKKYFRVRGIALTNQPKFIKVRFGHYAIPEDIKNAMLKSTNHKEAHDNVESIYPCLGIDINSQNYVKRFRALLYIEEVHQFIQFRVYDQDRAHFTKEGEYLSLEIENLNERRPSLIIGDMIYAKNPSDNNSSNNRKDSSQDTVYQAWIHKVLCNRILVKFANEFHNNYNGEDYNLQFFFSRLTFRKQHHVLDRINKELCNESLFPKQVILKNKPLLDVSLQEEENFNLVLNQTQQLNWFNDKLNHVQKFAIMNILRGEARPLPYIVFGPPGTGKTITLIETILQIFQNNKSARLLIGTPSNSSADLITGRLIESKILNRGDFIRLVGQHVIERDLIPKHLKSYCATIDVATEGTRESLMTVTESGLKLKCQKQTIGQHRITIGTCITLGTLIQLGFSKDHFTHVIIDEAGQCTEPEIMVVLSQIDKSGQIILAGDPLQLGPVVLNTFANNRGLGISYLVRLLQSQPYAYNKQRINTKGYNPRLVTKLIYNYRSLPSILNTFNSIFYNSELLPCVDDNNSPEAELLKRIAKCLPTYSDRASNYGALFYGIRGKNRQENESPSWYNDAEARQLFALVLNLYNAGIQPDNIGIITPYQMQVRKIRNLFEITGHGDLPAPKIGSVEEFQGQERDIIIISTVRSSRGFLELDVIHSLGFVQNEKRMNVAISRARSLLIIFGNPHLLSLDKNWRKLLQYCVDNNGYSGCDLPIQLQNKST